MVEVPHTSDDVLLQDRFNQQVASTLHLLNLRLIKLETVVGVVTPPNTKSLAERIKALEP